MAARGRPRKLARKPEVPVLGVNEMTNLKNAIDADKQYIREASGTSDGDPETYLAATDVMEMDLGGIERRLHRNERAIEQMGPGAFRLTGAKRQDAEKEREVLKEWLQEHMLTWVDVNAFPSVKDEYKDMIYQQALRKAIQENGENSNIFIDKATRWKRLGRILDPENPESSNMNSIRPQGQASGRHF